MINVNYLMCAFVVVQQRTHHGGTCINNWYTIIYVAISQQCIALRYITPLLSVISHDEIELLSFSFSFRTCIKFV